MLGGVVRDEWQQAAIAGENTCLLRSSVMGVMSIRLRPMILVLLQRLFENRPADLLATGYFWQQLLWSELKIEQRYAILFLSWHYLRANE